MSHKFVPCKLCKNGVVFSPHQQEFVPCDLCNGIGQVIENKLCACGFPVRNVSNGIYFCGNDSCLSDLKIDLQEETKPTQRQIWRHGYGWGPA